MDGGLDWKRTNNWSVQFIAIRCLKIANNFTENKFLIDGVFSYNAVIGKVIFVVY